MEHYNTNLVKKKFDAQVIEDSEWDKVVQQAKKVVKLWNEDEVAKKYIDYENLPEYFRG